MRFIVGSSRLLLNRLPSICNGGDEAQNPPVDYSRSTLCLPADGECSLFDPSVLTRKVGSSAGFAKSGHPWSRPCDVPELGSSSTPTNDSSAKARCKRHKRQIRTYVSNSRPRAASSNSCVRGEQQIWLCRLCYEGTEWLMLCGFGRGPTFSWSDTSIADRVRPSSGFGSGIAC